MGSLTTSLLNATNQLRVYGRAFETIQSNITNVNTPGYVKQIPSLATAGGQQIPGASGEYSQLSARSAFLEQVVRNQQQRLGSAGQRAADLALVEAQFDLTSQFGIPAALNSFFNGFSELAVNPNSLQARRNVLDLAAATAASFQHTGRAIQEVAVNVDVQSRAGVEGINRIAAHIAELNRQYRTGAAALQDANLDAQLHAALEELSQLVDFTTVRTADGAANVYLGGQTILVMGDTARPLGLDISGAQTVIRDHQGADITAQIHSGRLGGLLAEKNTLLPGYLADLHVLAEGFATSVNAALAQGLDRDGQPPAADLFTLNSLTGAAFTLEVNPLTPAQIAAASPGNPGGNGNALAVAQLGSAPALGGVTFQQFFGQLSGRVGREVASARQELTRYQDALEQARSQRTYATGVSLDEEATRLMQFQQSYQAVGKLLSVLNELTEVVLGFLR